MQKLKGFPAFGSHTVAFEVELEDGAGKVTKWPLKHIFREPNAEDKMVYYSEMAKRQTTNDKGEAVLTEGDLSIVAAILYDLIITNVTGYDFGGKKPDDWKANIPAEHKRWAIDRLVKNSGVISTVQEKN